MSAELTAQLVENHRSFLGFLERRVNDRAIAEDILQDAFVKTLEKGQDLREQGSSVAWFYQMLRNSVVDQYRRTGARNRALEGFAREIEGAVEPPPDIREVICGCVSRLAATLKPENTICLWFDKDALEAARFYAATFPDSEVTAVHEAPADYPGGKKGDALTVEFTVLGIPCLGLNGGPEFRHSEAFSFQIATDNQEDTDRYWNAIVNNGGEESQCGWCRDRWGLSWQITPRVLTDALAAGGDEAKRAFEAMMPMKKIDIATIEVARRG